MIYTPFFDMNILLSSDSLYSVTFLVAVLMFSHAFLAVYLIFRFIHLFKKSGLRLAAPRI